MTKHSSNNLQGYLRGAHYLCRDCKC